MCCFVVVILGKGVIKVLSFLNMRKEVLRVGFTSANHLLVQ